ncbi:GTP 3',8-cyclase MoaA [bacterium]|nr:GTP 3',8-cyclase MoaA [bacterium]MCI0602476.1 GTP 3',8-cyclase MoaA [bacterium]
MLIDKFGRQATDLRISVTDRCNYRCVYCMPAEVQWLPKPQILTFEELEHLVTLFAREGVTKLRLTGGEPLVRRDLPLLAERLNKIEGIQEISITTNGFYLKEYARALKAAGIQRLNVSLDSLRPDRFEKITRSNSFHRVMEGIAEAKAAGFDPIKVNCVPIRGFNDDEILDFLEWGAEQKLQIRFIEFMPLDGDHNWKRENVLTEAEILERVKQEKSVVHQSHSKPAPAMLFEYSDRSGEFGVIPSVTKPFCADCSRIRLTADGKFRNCLFALQETDLLGPLRRGVPDNEIKDLIRNAVYHKWAGHKINDPDFEQPARAMYAIGG